MDDRYQENGLETKKVTTRDVKLDNKNEPADDMIYFISLIKLLREMMEESKGIGRFRLVDADEFINVLNDIDNNLPVAIQYGLQMYSERERIQGDAESWAQKRVEDAETEARDTINTAEMRAKATLDDAKQEADRLVNDASDEAAAIIADAKERAEIMISEDEIVRCAKEEARAIKNDARIEISEERLKVNHETLQMLTGIEESMASALETISRRRKELEN